MRILGICSGSYFFGKEAVAINVMKGIKKNGHSIIVIFSGWNDGVFEKKLKEMGIKSYPLKLGWYYLRKISWSLDSLVHYPKALAQYIRIQKDFQPEILYVDSYRPIILLMPFLKAKIIYHVNDPHMDKRSDRVFLRLIRNRVSQFIAASEFIKKDLISAGVNKNKIVVIHNAIDMPDEESKEYLPKGKMRIGIVGQVIPRKGHEDLIQACSLIKGEVPFELYIYGSGNRNYIDHIKQLTLDLNITESVHWRGYEKNKKEIYQNLDVLIAPTRNDEPFALVALESSAYKVPVIATNSGGFPESIINNKSGYIVMKQSPEMIAEKIRLLFSNPLQLKTFGMQARNNIVKNFTSECMHDKMEKALAL